MRTSALLVGVGLVFLLGCGPEGEVRAYQVPKPPPEAAAKNLSDDYVILGALFPADDPAWFFKLSGKADALSAHQADFDKFLSCVRFPDGLAKPPVYDLPKGWTSTGPRTKSGIVITDTIRFGPEKKPFELTVTPAMGGVKENLKRWAGQVGTTGDPMKFSKNFKTTGGIQGVRVELTGPLDPASSKGPFMGGK